MPSSLRAQILPLDRQLARPFGSIPDSSYAEAIIGTRKMLGQTQTEFGALMGVTRSAVVKWESAKRPSVHLISSVVPEVLRAQAQHLARGDAENVAAAELLVHVTAFGEHVCASREAWLRLLHTSDAFFDELPVSTVVTNEEFYWGGDVGHALVAEHEGKSYREAIQSAQLRLDEARVQLARTWLGMRCMVRCVWLVSGRRGLDDLTEFVHRKLAAVPIVVAS